MQFEKLFKMKQCLSGWHFSVENQTNKIKINKLSQGQMSKLKEI